MKKNVLLSMLVGWIVVVSLIVIGVALRLQKIGTRPIVPSVPESKPGAEGVIPPVIPDAAACRRSMVIVQSTSTPTPTGPISTSTPTPSPTPTSTPTIRITASPTPTRPPTGRVIQGRFYEDSLTRPPVGRGGFSSNIPVCLDPATKNNGCLKNGVYRMVPIRIDIEIQPARPDLPHHTYDIANWPNTVDICSSSAKQERRYCGWANVTDVEGRKYAGTHCSKYGGFSLTIPENAKISNYGGKDYYSLLITANEGEGNDDINYNWVITEAYWMDVRTTVTPRPGATFPYNTGTTRCDCTTLNDKRCQRSTPQCNTCVGGAIETGPGGTEGTWAKICGISGGSVVPGNCTGYILRYPPSKKAMVLVPVNSTYDNLWVGLAIK